MPDTSARGKARRALVLLLVFAGPALVLMLLASAFVWLPDSWRQGPWVVQEVRLPDGNRFVFEQEWNGVDFYTSYFRHYAPDGSVSGHQVDGDDRKRWFSPMTINTQRSEVYFEASSRPCVFDWKSRTLDRGFAF